MKKTYIAKGRNGLIVPVTENGQCKLIQFRPIHLTEDSMFVTENEEIQKCIEGKDYFGPVIVLQSSATEEKKETKEDQQSAEVEEYTDVTRLAEAKRILVTLGADETLIKKKADIIALAKQYNVAFPNLK